MARDEKLELLRKVPLFRGFGPSEIQRLGTLTDEIDVPAGKTLIREGQTGDEFFVIVSGSVRIEKDGRPMRSLGAGEFLGEIALVDGRPRSATAVAETDCRLLVVAHREFHSLMDEFPSVQRAVLLALAERVRAAAPEALD